MTAQFVKHKLIHGTGETAHTFYFFAPDGQYTGIETETGVTKLAPTDAEQSMPTCTVEQLLRSPAASRRIIRYGAALPAKQKHSRLLVASGKLAAFETGIATKAYKGGTIKGVSEPLSASFS